MTGQCIFFYTTATSPEKIGALRLGYAAVQRDQIYARRDFEEIEALQEIASLATPRPSSGGLQYGNTSGSRAAVTLARVSGQWPQG
jgi:hypothetical protein